MTSHALRKTCATELDASIDTQTQLTDVGLLCPGCGTMAASIGGTIRDGVALLLGLSAAATTTRLLEVPVDDIDAADTHARRSPGHDIEAFVASVQERGIVTPLVARRAGTGFQVIDGVRRLYAARIAGLTTVPAVVRDATNPDALIDGLVANLHRADLNPIERAHAYQHALEQLDCSKAELGRRLSISREQVSNTIRLLALPIEDQERIARGDLTAEGGRALLRAPRPATAPLPDITAALSALLTAKVRVTRSSDRSRIVIDVPDADLARVLEQLGVQAVAA